MAANKKDSVPPDAELSAALRAFIRAEGSGYLRDPNVSSIGIGYKVRQGKRTDEVCVQFTVDTKATPEQFEALNTAPLPESVSVAGITVRTDVLQRSYRPDFRVVAEADVDARKTRIDPVRPGVSVGHPTITCGTIGAIVYDRETGTPYALSNWHVLHGGEGALGDAVVQPGTHDDNRTQHNGLGALVRSHLGGAGGGAVAAIEGRGIDPAIIDLDVAPNELGDPELGDKVVKSGRTTGVTHGVVRRVDTIAKIDYGGATGTVEVGCVEIGVDSARRAHDDEISKGGDSGAAWLFKSANGRPTTVLAGLHFAGEGGADPDEHALACLPRSVFDKLGITLTRPEGVEASAALGYDADFLGVPVAVPDLDPAIRDDAVELDGTTTVDYTHFSLSLSASRKFAFWVAWNIDGGGLKKISRTGVPFRKDPRLPATTQVGDELYSRNRLDRGHLARRADLLWGTIAEAGQANRDSFFFTNITPQIDDFNQSSRDGLWGRLEDAVFDDVSVDDLRVSVFGGPVFTETDQVFRGVAIPKEFWKVITWRVGGELRAAAFVLTQNLDQLEAVDLDEFRVFQVRVGVLEERVGIRFADVVRGGDTSGARAESLDEPLTSLSDIAWG